MKYAQLALGETATFDFVVSNPTTGAAATASAVTVRVFVDANDTAIITPTAAERTSLTGNYRVQVAATTANGFEEGRFYNVVVEATVAGVTARGVIASFKVAPPIYRGSVVADGANTATTFETDLAESTADHWRDSLLVFISGSLAGQVKKITGYNGTTKFVTFTSGFTGTPSGGDRFILVNL